MRRQLLVGVAMALAVVSGQPAGVLAGPGAAPEPRGAVVPSDDAKAAAIMAEARKALGGEKKLSGLKALSLRAEFRREMSAGGPMGGGGGTFVMMGGGGAVGSGGAQMTGSIEIDLLFPDKFYRAETSTGGLAMTRVDGFDGDRPFLDIISNNPGTRIMADRGANDAERQKAMLRNAHRDLGRLMLGLVGGTQAGLPVKYAYVGQAESPDGTAHVIDVTGPDDFKVRLFIDTTSHLPLMLTYSEPEPIVRMMTQHGPAPAGASGSSVRVPPQGGGSTGRTQVSPEQLEELRKQAAAAESAPRKMIDYRLFFSDYREVNGVQLPHRIARGNAEKTTEEWEIKSYKVNPDIKPDRFKVGL